MQFDQSCAKLFSFRYQPLAHTTIPDDGGFEITLYGNYTVVYNTFHHNGIIVSSHTFAVSPSMIASYLQMVDCETWWLRHVSLNTHSWPLRDRSYFFVSGHPPFSFDNITMCASDAFNEQRGLQARRILLLLENISDMLIPFGLYVTPWSFQWDMKVAQEVTIAPQGYTEHWIG